LNCHICNQNTISFNHEKTNIVFHHCKKCECIFKSTEYYKDFKDQEMRYNLHDNNENSEGYKAYFQRFLDFSMPHIMQEGSALDFGCGKTTLLSKMLEKKGFECDYYDPIYYPNILSEYKKYNLIVSVEVFEHLHKPRKVFENLVQRLEEGGHLIIQTEFHSDNIEKFKQWYYHQDFTHIVFFRIKTFEILCEQFKCKIIAHNKKNIVIIEKV